MAMADVTILVKFISLFKINIPKILYFQIFKIKVGKTFTKKHWVFATKFFVKSDMEDIRNCY